MEDDRDDAPMLQTGATQRKVGVHSTLEVLSQWEQSDSTAQRDLARRFQVGEEKEHGHQLEMLPKLKAVLNKEKSKKGPKGPRVQWNPSLRPGVKNSMPEVKMAMKRISQASKYDTINYIEVGSDIQKAWNFERPPKDYWMEDFWRWFNPCIAAVILALISFSVTISLKWANILKFGVTEHFLKTENYVAAYFAYVSICTFYAFISGCLVSFLSPAATGGGIAEVKMFLNGIHVPGILSMKTLIAKMVGIVFTIAGGIIAGKEGPFVHAGAIVGGGIGVLGSDWITRLSKGKWVVKLPRWMGGYHRNAVDHRDFTAIGTALGIAVAFNAPIGGLLFTVEEGASFYSRSSFWRAFLATGVSVMAVNLVFLLAGQAEESSFFSISHEELGAQHQFELAGGYYYRLWELPIFAAIGVCGGLAGALLVTYQSRISILRAKFIPASKSWRRVFEVMAMAFITASIWYVVLATSPCVEQPKKTNGSQATMTQTMNGDDFYQDPTSFAKEIEHYDNMSEVDAGRLAEELLREKEQEQEHLHSLRPQLQCPDGYFNKYAQLFFTDLGGALRRMVVLGHEVPNDTVFSWEVVGLYYLLAQVMFIVSYGIGCPAGLFVPTLTFGAAFGLFAAHGVRHTLAEWWNVPVSFQTYAVIGSAAFLGGTTRMIVSVTVLVAETTGAAGLMVPIMVANYTAKLVGDLFNHSIYDFAMFSKGGPVLEEAALVPHQKMILDKLQASEMMTTNIVALPLQPKVSDVIDLLRACSHSTIAVTPTPEKAEEGEPFELHGVIRQSQLLRLLKHRLGVMTEEEHRTHETQIREQYHAGSHSKEGNGNAPPPNQMDPVLFEHMIPAMIVAAQSKKSNLEMLELLEEIPVKLRLWEQTAILNMYSPEEAASLRLYLEPFMDRESTVVCGIETLAKTYSLFRTMGHHHVFVSKDRPIVEGLICRKDLLEDIAKLKLGEKANRFKMNLLDEAITLSTIPFLPEEKQRKLRGSQAQGLDQAAIFDDEADGTERSNV